MSEEVIVKVENLSKKFCRSLKRSMLYGSTDVFKNMLGIKSNTSVLRKAEFWSLENINFELKKGKSLGIIGTNGSGKSTLLRILNGIFPPDKGRVVVRGRTGALIAVGAGFHPHLTGRENIYLNGTILGMSKKEIDSKFGDITSFADIGSFLDAPVSTYSSGMTVRLGFAIAINSEPDLLLADEILAVGDLAFALKCYRKISEFKEKGGSIILVSHGMQLIRNTCDDVLWIQNGKTKMYGNTQEVCDEYEKYIFNVASGQAMGEEVRINTDKAASIENIRLMDSADKPLQSLLVGEKLKIVFDIETKRVIKNPMFTIGINNAENISVIANYSNFDGLIIEELNGKKEISFEIDQLNIKPGIYSLTITLVENNLSNVLDWREKVVYFTIESKGHTAYGLYNIKANWNIK